MNREQARVVLVAVVCVLAVATAAATLTSPTTPATTEAGGDSLQSDADAETEGDDGSAAADPIGNPGDLSFDVNQCVPWLYSAPFWTVVAIVAMLLWLIIQHRTDPIIATASLTVLAIPFTFVWLLFSNCGTSTDEPASIIPSDLNVTPSGNSASYGVLGDGPILGMPLWLIALVAVLGIGAVGIATMRDSPESQNADEEEVPADAKDRLPPELAGLTRVAGDAADRIERNAHADNEIYRAWIEMTSHLDVDHPDSSTPGEFQTAAVDAGVDHETVAELTALFERVRYGHERPTADREARAVSALRALEAQRDGSDEQVGSRRSGGSRRSEGSRRLDDPDHTGGDDR